MRLFNRNGTLWIDLVHEGQRVRKSLKLEDTKANRKLAQTRIIPELMHKLGSGQLLENPKPLIPTLDAFAPVSFAMNRTSRRGFTQAAYDQAYRQHISPHFGRYRLDAIKPSQLALWQSGLLETLSPKRVNAVRMVFGTILQDALKDELISKNPFALIKAPKDERVKEIKPFSIEEIRAILEHTDPRMRAFFAVGFFTGMRTGEILALRWSDVELDKRIIHVTKSRRDGIEDKPKTPSSIRRVEILDALMPYLIAHQEINPNGAYLFETGQGQPFHNSDKVRDWYWKRALKAAKVPYRPLYHTRHSFATLMISNGEDILWVSAMLGHKDSTTTLETYAKYIPIKGRKRGAFLSE